MKLTEEQKTEVLSILNEMYENAEKQMDELKSMPDIWCDTLNDLFVSTLSDIKRFADKVVNDEKFELSKDFWRTAFIYEIVNTKNKDDLIAVNKNMGFCCGFNGKLN